MNYIDKLRKIHIKENIKHNNKEYCVSLLRVNDKNSIKEYYNLY